MRVLTWPLRLDDAGGLSTVEQWSDAQAAQVAAHVVSTVPGERPLAPQFGLTDAVGVGFSEADVRAAVQLCEPDIEVSGVVITGPAASRQTVSVSVRWRDDDDLGGL